MYIIYVLKSKKDSKLYYGLTKNIEDRLKKHNSGSVSSTKSRAPFDLIYFEKAENISTARKREKYFKSGFGRKYIRGKIKNIGLIV